MIDIVIAELANKLSPEVIFTATFLNEKYGPMLTAQQYCEQFNIKTNTLERQISNETVAIKPRKVGKANFFPTIEVAKYMHGS